MIEEDIREVILEALNDYSRWFEHDITWDDAKLELISKAEQFIRDL